MRRKRLIGMILYFAVIANTFWGCKGRTDEADIASDLQDMSSGETINTDSDSEEPGIPEHVSYTIESQETQGKIAVDADVDARTYNQMGVYEQRKSNMTEQELKSLADSLFDEGKYEVRKPYWMMTEDELQVEYHNWEDIIYTDEGLLGDTNEFSEVACYFSALDDSSESATQFINKNAGYRGELIEGQMIYEKGDTGVCESRLVGMVDGMEWELRYRSEPYILSFKPIVADINVGMEVESLEYTIPENKVDYDSACKEAYDAIDRLNVGDMNLFGATQFGLMEDEKFVYDGYVFIFTRQITQNGIVDKLNNPITYISGSADKVVQEYVSVGINSTGLLWVDIYNRYDVVGELADKTVKLDFNQVDEIAREYMQDYLDEVGISWNIKCIELRYLTVSYDDKYALVPFWIYGSRYIVCNDCECTVAMLGVNAIDGSILLAENIDYIEFTSFYGRLTYTGYDWRYNSGEVDTTIHQSLN